MRVVAFVILRRAPGKEVVVFEQVAQVFETLVRRPEGAIGTEAAFALLALTGELDGTPPRGPLPHDEDAAQFRVEFDLDLGITPDL